MAARAIRALELTFQPSSLFIRGGIADRGLALYVQVDFSGYAVARPELRIAPADSLMTTQDLFTHVASNGCSQMGAHLNRDVARSPQQTVQGQRKGRLDGRSEC
jgi:hypothetical protein